MVQKSNTGSRAHYDPGNALLATSGHQRQSSLISDILLQKTTFTVPQLWTNFSIVLKQFRHTFNGPLSGTTQVSRYQKGKTNLDFTEARGSGISWAICKSAPRSRQITTPVPHHSVSTGWTPFLPPNQQHQKHLISQCST